MLGRRRGAQVRLQRDVAEILEEQNAQVARAIEIDGIGSGIAASNCATRQNGSASESNGSLCSARTREAHRGATRESSAGRTRRR